VAYVVGVRPGGLTAGELKRYLAQRLPPYMLPAHIVQLDRLPLNVNGKVDRSALPPPNRQSSTRAVASSPTTEWEGRLTRLWGRILNCGVGLEDNFFDLGGTALQR